MDVCCYDDRRGRAGAGDGAFFVLLLAALREEEIGVRLAEGRARSVSSAYLDLGDVLMGEAAGIAIT